MKTQNLILIILALIITVLIVLAGVFYSVIFPTPIPISTSSPSPTPYPTLLPLPWAASIIYPEPNSTNVPLNANISIRFGRPPQIVELSLYPSVDGWRHRLKEIVGVASGKYTFNFSEPFKPGTTYTATVIYGQVGAPGSYSPIETLTWHFTTTITPAPTPH